MKKSKRFLLLLFLGNLFCVTSAFAQQGILKIFSEAEAIIVFVDEIQQTNLQEIRLSPGTHYVRAMSGTQKVYNDIVTIRTDETTTLLIKIGSQEEVPKTSTVPPAAVPKNENKTGVVNYNSNPANNASPISPPQYPIPVKPVEPIINIGQVNGKLPANKTGAFGLTFGMSESEVNTLIQPQMYQAGEKGKGYLSYVFVDQTTNPVSPFMVECRFMDGKLFQILVAYLPTETDPKTNQISINKNVIPWTTYNKIQKELTDQYGTPTFAEELYSGGFAKGDGRELEAMKKKKAFFLTSWQNTDTGNETFMTLAYNSMPLVMVAYQDGAMSKEAQQRKLVIHAYKYEFTFKENFFSK